MKYSTSRLDEVQIYLCPSVSICGSPNLMYCTQQQNRYIPKRQSSPVVTEKEKAFLKPKDK
jgi:hypothetical protein